MRAHETRFAWKLNRSLRSLKIIIKILISILLTNRHTDVVRPYVQFVCMSKNLRGCNEGSLNTLRVEIEPLPVVAQKLLLKF